MSLLLFYSCSSNRKDIMWQNNTESLKRINVANMYGSMAPVQVFCSLLDNVVSDLLCPPSFLPLPPFPRLSLLAVLCVLHYETSPLPRSELSSKMAQTSCGGHPAVKDSYSVFLCKYLLPRSSFALLQRLYGFVFAWVGVGVNTLGGEMIADSFQNYTFSEVSLYDRNSSPGTHHLTRGCVLHLHACEALWTLCEKW